MDRSYPAPPAGRLGMHLRIFGRRLAVGIEAIAAAVTRGDALLARSLTLDWLQSNPAAHNEPAPETTDPTIRAVSASLVELFAERLGQPAPAWTAQIGPLDKPFYLLKSAQTLSRLRRLCEQESPEPLRRRRLYAPSGFLTFA